MVFISLVSILAILFIGVVLYEVIEVKTIYNNALELVDKNYDNIYSVYGDKIPEKEEFIDNLKKTYKTVHPFVIPAAFTDLFDISGGSFTYANRVLLVTSGDFPFTRKSSLDECSRFFIHELIHADGHENLLSSNLMFLTDNIFVEGGAAFWEKYTSSVNFYDDAASLPKTDGSYYMEVGPTDFTYCSYLFQYTFFLTLTDCETLRRYNESGGNENIIINKIKENYGIDANDYWNMAIESESKGIAGYYIKQTDYFLNTFLIKDVEKISDSEEAFRMLNLYRLLKAQFIPRCYKTSENSTDDYIEKIYSTGDYIDIQTIENALFDKIRQYGILNGLSTDIDEQRYIYDCLLKVPDKVDNYTEGPNEYHFNIYDIPFNLKSVELVFNSAEMTLQIIDKTYEKPCAQFINGKYCNTCDLLFAERYNIYDDLIEPVEGKRIAF